MTDQVSSPNTPKHWRLVLGYVVCAGYFLYQFVVQVSPAVMVQPLMQSFHISLAQLGLFSLSFYIPYAGLQMVMGLLLDRYGIKIILLISLLICIVANLLMITTHAYSIAIISRVLSGIGSAAGFVCGSRFATVYFARKYEGLFIGLTSAAGMLGALLSGFLLSYLVQVLDWRVALEVTMVLAILLFLLGLLFVPSAKDEHALVTLGKIKITTLLKEARECLTSKRIIYLALVGAFLSAPTVGFSGLWGAHYFEHVFAVSTLHARQLNALIFLGGGIGLPLLGTWLTKPKYFIPGLLGSLVVTIIILAIYAWYPYPLSIMALSMLQLLLGFSCAAYIITFAKIALLAKSFDATALSFANMLSMISAMVVQGAFGYLADWFSLRAGVVFLLIWVLLGLCFMRSRASAT